MAHLLRLIAGHDKRSPVRSLTIANSNSSANIFLYSGGFSPSSGKKNVRWSGRNTRRDGQKRIGSGRDNSKFSITYNLAGGSAAELSYLQREITRFFEDVRLYEEDRQSTPCWLEYRWQDGLDDIPAPLFGQFSYYIRILDGGPPEWPKTLHNTGNLVAGNIEQVMCELTCEPFWEGLEQTLMNGVGQLEMTNHGILVAPAVTNLIPNPEFGHATWNTAWTASIATLTDLQETQTGFYRSAESAARLINAALGSQTYTVTLTLTATTYIIACHVRRPDGAAVTSADMTMWGQGASRTTTFIQVDGGPWYLAWASFTGVAASSTHGVMVLTGKTIIIDDVQLETRNATLLFPTPFCAGDKIGCLWAGTAHNSSSTRVAGFQKRLMTDEFTSQFTFSAWYTPHWSTAQGAVANLIFFRYNVGATDTIQVHFVLSTNVFSLSKTVASAAVSDTGVARTIAYKDRIHIAIVQDATNLWLYVNGVLDSGITVAVAPQQPAGGVLALGADSAGGSPSFTAVDGPRVWKTAFTAAQVLSLYNAEVEVKTAAGGIIGQAPVFWSLAGDGVLDAVNDASRNNFGVVVGVSGDVEALTEWRIQPPTSSPPRTYWLGRKATDENFDAALLFLEYQGTADANSSGGEYDPQTASVLMQFSKTITANLEIFQGHYQYIGRFFVSTNNVTVLPRYHFVVVNAESVFAGDEVTIATAASFVLRDFGDLNITYPRNRLPPPALVVQLAVTPVTGSATVRTDFIQLLPSPACRVQSLDASVGISAGDLLIVSGEDAYIRRTSTGAHRYEFEHRGETVDVMPNKYNTIYFIPGEEGQQYFVTHQGTFTVLITPRWLLPGGAVA